METLVLFLCVSAAVVLTNGLILFGVAWYVLKALERISKAEYERLSQIQQQGLDTAKTLMDTLRAHSPMKRSPFGGGDPFGSKGGGQTGGSA